MGVFFITVMQSMMHANNRLHYGLKIVFVFLQITLSRYRHYADWYENIEKMKITRQVHSIDRMSEVKSILSTTFCKIYMAECFSLSILFWWLCEYLYFILPSSNRKYASLATVWGRSWNDKCTLVLCSFWYGCPIIKKKQGVPRTTAPFSRSGNRRLLEPQFGNSNSYASPHHVTHVLGS